MAASYLAFETGARTYRMVLPSRIRRGRMATSPVWRVELVNGEVWQFQRRKDALVFANAGRCKHLTMGDDRCRDGHCVIFCGVYRIADGTTENRHSTDRT